MALLSRMWSRTDLGIGSCPAAIAGADGPLVVFGTVDGCVVALDRAGAEAWRVPLGGPVTMSPAVDTRPDGLPVVLAASQAGRAACITPDGSVRWSAELPGGCTAFNSLAAVRGTPGVAFAATTRDGIVVGLGAGGEIRWEFHTHADAVWRQRGVGPAAIGDLDGDGRDEIVVSASDGHVVCLTSNGEYRWSVYAGNASQWSGPVIADFGGGPCVIAGGTADILRCIGPDGEARWEQRGVGAGFIELGVAIADLDGDGADEIVFLHQGRGLHAVDRDGVLLWGSFEFKGGDQPFGPALADLDGDERAEILLVQRHLPELRVVRGDGTLAESHALPDGALGAPVLADVDGDGLLEALVATGPASDPSDAAGVALTCFRTGVPAQSAPRCWAAGRGALDGRGSRGVPQGAAGAGPTAPAHPGDAGLRLVSPVRLRLGANEFVCEAPGECGEASLIEVTVQSADGVPRRSVIGDARRPALAVELLAPGPVQVLARHAADVLEMSAVVFRGDPGPYNAEREEVAAGLRELAAMVDGAGALRAEFERIHRGLRYRWAAAEERIAGLTGRASEERRDCTAEVRGIATAVCREVACWRVRTDAIAQAGGRAEFLPWLLEHPWTPFQPEAAAPPTGAPAEIVIRTDGRAHEALAMEVANALPVPQDVRVWLDPLVDASGAVRPVRDHVTLRQATLVPTLSGGRCADALPDLGDAGILRIAGSSSARLWIDLRTGDLPAGDYATTLRMRALTAAGTTWSVPVRWTVAPVALPVQMPLRFCNWAMGYAQQFAHAPDAALRDMHDHHTSIHVHGVGSVAEYGPDGGLIGAPDWSALDAAVSTLEPNDIVLFGGYATEPVRPGPGADGPFSDAWRAAMEVILPQLVERLAARGVGTDRWAFYPVDEPGIRNGALIDILEQFAREVKRIDPRVQIYTDPYRGFTVPDYERLRDVLDIVQPSQYFVVKSDNTDRGDYLQASGMVRWIYEARSHVKDMAAPAYYWDQIWTAWKRGYTGVGYWTYCTTGYDLWEAAADWVMVYQGAAGPVPSARWQAIRIGIEDHARLVRLRDAALDAASAGRTEECTGALELVARVVVEVEASGWDPAVVARVRQQVIDAALALGAVT